MVRKTWKKNKAEREEPPEKQTPKEIALRLYQAKLQSAEEKGRTKEDIEYARAVPELTFQPNPHKRCSRASAAALS